MIRAVIREARPDVYFFERRVLGLFWRLISYPPGSRQPGWICCPIGSLERANREIFLPLYGFAAIPAEAMR